MPFADTFLPEFDQEMKTTRSLLERVPFDHPDWKPHAKSTALAKLASHIVALTSFGTRIVGESEVDMEAAGRAPQPQYDSADTLLAAFDANVRTTRASITALRDEDLGTPWTLRSGAHVIFTQPRAAVIRTMMMNHIIHHRGQLSVYLRLNDVPLPSIYGPTADT